MEISAPKRKAGIQSRRLGDEWMLYDPDTGSLHVVNELAAFVWQLCDGSSTFEDMCQRIEDEYDVPDGTDVRTDVREAVDALAGLGVLEAG